MKKISMVLCAAAALGFSTKALAQVQGISFTVSPTAQYTWWDKNLNLGDVPFWGVRAGVGFGPILELRGSYERSYDLKGKLKSTDWGLFQNLADKLEKSDVDVARYGAEVKVNLWPGTIVTPYLTAGAGVLDFKYKDVAANGEKYKEKQLYGALGAGLKINLHRRVVLSLEGRNILFNLNENNKYLAPGVSGNKILQNWSAGLGLDFYLGGDYSNTTSGALAAAYRNLYTDGFRSLKFVVEPGVAYVDFRENSLFNDQWFLGGSVGVDFSSLFGIRGFYYQATKTPNTLNFKFNNDLKMYGGNFVARLNFPRGVTPYLNLGAGYLDVKKDSYEDINGTLSTVKSGWFALGGAGLEIPVSRWVALYGNVNAMLNSTENPDVSAIMEPNDINWNWMYQAGVRINLGVPSRSAQGIYDAQISSINAANNAEINRLRASYEERIESLNKELAEAASRQDNLEVSRIINEKEQVEKAKAATQGQVSLTPSEFNALVQRVVAELDARDAGALNAQNIQSSSLTDLDKILLINALQNGQLRGVNAGAGCPMKGGHAPIQHAAPAHGSVAPASADAKIDALLEKMDRVVDKMDQQASQMRTLNTLNRQQAMAAEAAPSVIYIDADPASENVAVSTSDGYSYTSIPRVESALRFRGISVLTGPSLGDGFRWNVGARGHFQILKSNWELLPEVTLGFGKSKALSVSANAVYNFESLKLPVVPYAGVGIGYFGPLSEDKFTGTFLVGAYIPQLLGGKVYVDYSSRGLFRGNAINVGYRFTF